MKQFTLLITFYFFTASFAIAQQPGTLDSSFGENGKVISSTTYYNICNDVMVQHDGKIIQAGSGGYNGIGGFLLLRLLANGLPDTSFGLDGWVITDLGFDGEIIYSVTEQPDKKIVAAGFVSSGDIAITRYMPDGSLDSSFGANSNGIVITNVDGVDNLRGMTLLPDGKIAVAGFLRKNENDIDRSFTVRYLPDGRIDESFGDKGVVITIFDRPAEIYCIAAQPDGKILIGGLYDFSSNGDFVIVRYLTNGAVDPDFGTDGIAKAGFADIYDYSNAQLNSMLVQPDGKILAAGGAGEAFEINMALARFETNGSLDKSFGENGRAVTSFNTDGNADAQAKKVLLQPDGKIIVAGRYSNYSTFSYFALARFKSDGKIDSSFGIDGMQTTDFGSNASCEGAALQEDGKIILAGSVIDIPNDANNFALARYNGDKERVWFVRIKKWLHRHGFTWDDFPGNNISYYAVQRSSNGTAFNEISRLFNRNNQQQFSYEDASPLTGNNYYRLAAVSADGSMAYSNVIAIDNSDAAIKLFPNPVKNNLHVEGLPAGQRTKLTITDINGNTRMTAVTTGNSFDWNVSLLKQGNYLLRVENNNNVVAKKFIKE